MMGYRLIDCWPKRDCNAAARSGMGILILRGLNLITGRGPFLCVRLSPSNQKESQQKRRVVDISLWRSLSFFLCIVQISYKQLQKMLMVHDCLTESLLISLQDVIKTKVIYGY